MKKQIVLIFLCAVLLFLCACVGNEYEIGKGQQSTTAEETADFSSIIGADSDGEPTDTQDGDETLSPEEQQALKDELNSLADELGDIGD